MNIDEDKAVQSDTVEKLSLNDLGKTIRVTFGEEMHQGKLTGLIGQIDPDQAVHDFSFDGGQPMVIPDRQPQKRFVMSIGTTSFELPGDAEVVFL